MTTKLVFVHALSPLHAGTGQGAGVIDLPIAREKATNLPYLPGSSLKGPLRDRATDTLDKNLTERIFGNSEVDNLTMGAVQFSDLHLLCLPVRSLYGTFAWVSSPYVLNRFARGLGLKEPQPIKSDLIKDNQAIVSGDSALVSNSKVYLEDLDLTRTINTEVSKWGNTIADNLFSLKSDLSHWNEMFTQRFCVVSDNVLSFLLNTATEITARISLDDDKKTVKKGALWYEEALPAESILTGLMLIAPPKAKQAYVDALANDLVNLCEKPIQLGGKATVGRGICRVIVK